MNTDYDYGYGYEGSYPLGSPFDGDLLDLDFLEDLHNSGHTEATMNSSFTEGYNDSYDDLLLDTGTRASRLVHTNTYARPRSAVDGGATRRGSWSSFSNNHLRNSPIFGPLFGLLSTDLTNTTPKTCCTCVCTCSSRVHASTTDMDDPLLFRPIQEVQPSPPSPTPCKANPFGLKRNRSDSSGRRRNRSKDHIQLEISDPVSDLKFKDLRVSPPGSPGSSRTTSTLSHREQSPIAKKMKKGLLSVKNFATGKSRGGKLPEPNLLAFKEEEKPKKKCTSSITTATLAGIKLPEPKVLVSKKKERKSKKKSTCSITTASTASSSACTPTTTASCSSSLLSSSTPQKKRIRRKEPTVKKYVEIEPNDVLLGRGGLTNGHHGNLMYRRHILRHQPAYKSLEKHEKLQMSKDVVLWVKMRGGRFLARDDSAEGRPYYEATYTTARLKVSQALREDHTPEGRELKKSRLRT